MGIRAGLLVGLGLGLGLGFVVPAGAAAAQQQPYEGDWGGTREACLNDDSDDRLAIEGSVFTWYETRCEASQITVAGPRSWTASLSCEGEGRRFRVRPRISLPSSGQLVMEDGPVGRDPARQTYVRCGMRG